MEELGDEPPHWRYIVRLLRGRPCLVRIDAAVEQKPLEGG